MFSVHLDHPRRRSDIWSCTPGGTCSSKFQVSSKSVERFSRCERLKFAISYCLGHGLYSSIVLPYTVQPSYTNTSRSLYFAVLLIKYARTYCNRFRSFDSAKGQNVPFSLNWGIAVNTVLRCRMTRGSITIIINIIIYYFYFNAVGSNDPEGYNEKKLKQIIWRRDRDSDHQLQRNSHAARL